MGKEIVYCGGCGKSLREDDFAKGKAQHVDHRPYCCDCKPLPEKRPGQEQTSSKLAAMSKTSSGRYAPYSGPKPATTRRHAREDSSKIPLLIGAGLVAAAVIVLLVFALGGGRPAPEPEPPPAPPPAHASPPKASPRPAAPAPNADKAAAAVRDLEAFAISADNAVAILQRCDDLRPLVQGTVHEPRLKAVEERAKETRRVRQLESSLEEVSKLRALDPEFERKEEVLRLLQATLTVAGPRRGEVEALLRNYGKEAEAFASRPAPPIAPPSKPAPKPPMSDPPRVAAGRSLGPFETTTHGAITHWLILAPFGNRTHVEGLYDADLLRSEVQHVPAAGLEVPVRDSLKLRWTQVIGSEGRILLRQIEGLSSQGPAIAFAACWIEVENDMEVKFRTNADTGFYLIMDGKRIRNQASGHLLSQNADVFNIKLSKGPHLLLFKVATTEESFGLRFRITTISGERVPGIKVWNQPPGSLRPVFAESFNEGPGGFKLGELADGGIEGTKAYAMTQKKVTIEKIFKTPVTAETTIRFKVKPLFEVRNLHLMAWSNRDKANNWYHLQDLKKDEWNLVEVKAAALRRGYRMDGPSIEGDMPGSLTIYYDDQDREGTILLDDFEVLE